MNSEKAKSWKLLRGQKEWAACLRDQMGQQHSHSWLVGQQGALGRHCPRALRAQGWAQAAHWGQSLPDCAAQVGFSQHKAATSNAS